MSRILPTLGLAGLMFASTGAFAETIFEGWANSLTCYVGREAVDLSVRAQRRTRIVRIAVSNSTEAQIKYEVYQVPGGAENFAFRASCDNVIIH